MKSCIIRLILSVLFIIIALFIICFIGFSDAANTTSYKVETSAGDIVFIKVQNNIPMRSSEEHRVEISVKGFKGTTSWIFEGSDYIKKGDEKVLLIDSGNDHRRYRISFDNYSYNIIVYLDTNNMQLL